MWEEWRAAIDRSLADARRVDGQWYDRVFRSALRDPDRTPEQFRLFNVTTTAKGQLRREIPKTWRMRVSATRARPIL